MHTRESIRALVTASIAGALLSAGAMVASADDQKKPTDEKSFSRGEVQEASAKVESVDRANRKLVLAAADGKRESFTVGPEVRNFDRINEGDRVVLRYYTGLAAQIQPPGTPLQSTTGSVVTKQAKPGEQPAAGAGASVTATVQIEAVDTKENTVTFKRADGTTSEVAVEDPKGREFLKKLKRGDQVEVVYTEALAVSVDPVQK